MVIPEKKYEDWKRRAIDDCDGDLDCLARFFMESYERAETIEAKENIIDAFTDFVLPSILDEYAEKWFEEMGLDLAAWEAFFREVPDEWRDTVAFWLAQRFREWVYERVEEALEDPEARKMFRPYMLDLIDDIVEGYILGLTQREIAERAWYSLHSIWNTTWWLRKYAEVDLWPARLGE